MHVHDALYYNNTFTLNINSSHRVLLIGVCVCVWVCVCVHVCALWHVGNDE